MKVLKAISSWVLRDELGLKVLKTSLLESNAIIVCDADTSDGTWGVGAVIELHSLLVGSVSLMNLSG